MNLTTTEIVRGAIPLPPRAFYEFGRQICIGCAVTFGRRSPKPKTIDPSSRETLTVQLVLIRDGIETQPLTRKLPGRAFDAQELAERIANLVAESPQD